MKPFRPFVMLLVLTPLMFTVSNQTGFSQISEDTLCKQGQVLVLRLNVEKYACVFDSTASIWETRGIAVAIPTPEASPQESDSERIFAVVPLGNESLTPGDLEVNVPDTQTLQRVENQLDLLIFKISQMQELATNTEIVNAVKDSNKRFAAMTDPYQYIKEKDDQWLKTPKDTFSPFMGSLIENNISDILREKSIIPTEEFGNVLFPEIFITNVYGANVAQSIRTEDYNQADENWWIRSKTESVLIRDVSWDESAQIFSADIVIRIVDEKGSFIGVLNAATPIR